MIKTNYKFLTLLFCIFVAFPLFAKVYEYDLDHPVLEIISINQNVSLKLKGDKYIVETSGGDIFEPVSQKEFVLVKYIVQFDKPITKGYHYINFLDEYEFSLHYCSIGNFSEGFTGITRGSFKIPAEVYKSFKYIDTFCRILH